MTLEGQEVGASRVPITWSRTKYGVEVDSGTLVDSAIAALRVALVGFEDACVLSIGVSSMAESGVLVDGADVPLGPVIAWHDTRDFAEVENLGSAISPDEFSLRTGLPFRSQWSLTKHRWLLDHVPSMTGAVRRYNVAEWVVRRLGGAPVTELSLASRTGWLDLATGAPWPEAMEWSGAHGVALGDLVTAGTPLGDVSDRHDLIAIRGATLTVAGHDHQAAAIGAGAIGAGDQLDSCGTAEALVRTIPAFLSSTAIQELTHLGITVGWHAVAGRWCVLGGVKTGLMLGQVLDHLGLGTADFAELDSEAVRAEQGRSRIDWRLPAYVELAGSDQPGDIWRAATRAVTVQVRDLSEAISRQVGAPGRLVVVGGWSHSAALMTAKTELLGPLRRSNVPEAGARGAAVLAGLAHGTYPSLDEAPSLGTEQDPCPS